MAALAWAVTRPELRHRELRRLRQHIGQALPELGRILRRAVDRAAGLVQRVLGADAEPDRLHHDRRLGEQLVHDRRRILARVRDAVGHDDEMVFAVAELLRALVEQLRVCLPHGFKQWRAGIGAHLAHQPRELLAVARAERQPFAHAAGVEHLQAQVRLGRHRLGEDRQRRLGGFHLGLRPGAAALVHAARAIEHDVVVLREEIGRHRPALAAHRRPRGRHGLRRCKGRRPGRLRFFDWRRLRGLASRDEDTGAENQADRHEDERSDLLHRAAPRAA